MPLTAVLLVLITVLLVLVYGVPTVQSRLSERAKSFAMAQAAATSDAITGEGTENWRSLFDTSNSEADAEATTDASGGDLSTLERALALYAEPAGGEIFVVDRESQIVAREGSRIFSPTADLLQKAAEGERIFEQAEGLNIAVVPVLYRGELVGGVLFAAEDPLRADYDIFMRSGIEAALLAAVLGSTLALLLATLLSRRVERLASGARAIEQGDLSHRIKPGFNDDLAELARNFNSMAEKLEDYFNRLKESGATLDAIISNLHDGVLATDLEGNVVFANHSARRILDPGSEGPLGELPSPWKDFDLPKAVARCAMERECVEARVSYGEYLFQVNLDRLPPFHEHEGGCSW